MKLKHKMNQISSRLNELHPIDSSLVSTLYTLSIKSLLTAIIFTILVTIFLYSELTDSIVVWCSILVSFLLLRLYHVYLFKTTPQIHSIETWYNTFMILAFLTAIMVSILGAVFIHSLNEYYQLFIVAALLGLTAGATTSLSSDLRIAIVYISIIMLPLIISMTMIHTSLAFILPVLMILFYFSQILMIFNSYTHEKEIKELKAEQNLLNNLFSEVPLGMFSYDKDLNVLYANKHLSKTFNYEENELTGLNLHSLHDTKFIDILQDTLTQGAQSYVGSYKAINGNTFWLETTWFPFKDINNKVLGGIGIIDDKTKEHMHEEELKSLHLTLQDQVKKNQFLLKENKQFIADMVHQIRTPLSVIMTNASLIEMNSESEISSYITQINSAINMLSNSYEDLSYIISNDTLEYPPMEINLTEFLEERIHFFEVIAQANNKGISTDIQNNINITINDTELERLIDNNISNAIKHSNDNSQIKVILKKVNSEIILQFISEGKNIYDVSRIFDKNYTECYGAKRSLGLGLNMVKTICEKNCTRYYAHSQEGINTFTYIFQG
ncbi:PAS domain-containing sensor histidine kinase [Sulfurovum sp. AR]|uniref:PAS domain-containing sensor histidine kinase n=1 Tax=Sulfurovum sp. AR TaxID=1165841 RepID=UPI00025C4D98|nr:PAS domain-containing sensor histidine kinase [Sulfurovum sp. AR]EIF50031.1 histidine kinase [Sulfurovum sp. AR]